jgi:hypothetical protein
MKPVLVMILLCFALALAAEATYKLSINGQASSTPAITVGGEVYVHSGFENSIRATVAGCGHRWQDMDLRIKPVVARPFDPSQN